MSPPTCVGVSVCVACTDAECVREMPGERDTVAETVPSFDDNDDREGDALSRPLPDDEVVREDDALQAPVLEADDDCEGEAEALVEPVDDNERRGDAESRSEGDGVEDVETDRDEAGERVVDAVAAAGLFEE